MKLTTTLALLLFVTLSINAQAPQWLWAKGTLGAYSGATENMAVDADGNIYMTGFFKDSTVIFGKDTLVNASAPAENMFLVKLDSSGNTLWARSAGDGANGSNLNDGGRAISIDGRGNVYVLGDFQTPVMIFGSVTLNNIGAQSFLVKYNSQGDALWAINVGVGFNNSGALVNDSKGNSYIVGFYDGTNVICGPDTLPYSENDNAFLLKYDSSGNGLWAQGIYAAYAYNYAPTIDGAGNIYVTGAFSGDSATAGNITLTGNGFYTVYVVKYDTAGNVHWAHNAVVNGNTTTSGITTDGQNNVYISGSTYGSTLIFGTDTVNTNASGDISNAFVAKFDSSGTIRWAKGTQGYGYVYGFGISVDAAGNAYTTGYFENSPFVVGNDTLTNTDTLDTNNALFIIKYDSSGNVISAMGGLRGGANADEGLAILAQKNGDVYVSGSYVGSGVILGNDTLPNTTNSDFFGNLFIAKYGTSAIIDTNGIAVVHVSSVTVYPNPSTGQFYFKGIPGGSTLEVYDVLGQNIFSTTISPSGGGKGEETYVLNISRQAKGIYFYRVTTNNNGVQDGKIILE